jgi:MscS family membrane protein
MFETFSHAGIEDEAIHPLAPPDMSSPRATIKTFLDTTNEAVAAFKRSDKKEARALGYRATRCLNLESEPPALKDAIGILALLYLKEILDRIEIPPYEDIPDAKTVEAQKLTSWTIPYTEITLAAVKNGSSRERFLFTNETVRRSESYYKQVKSLPYKPGAEGAMYEQLSSSAGLMFPRGLVDTFPNWARTDIHGEALWQWTGLILYFIFGALAVFLAYTCIRKALGVVDGIVGLNLRNSIGGLVLPIALILFTRIGLWFVVFGLHFFNVDVFRPIALIILLIFYVAQTWLIAAILNRLASVVINIGGFVGSSIDTQLIRLGFQVITLIVVGVTAVHLSARLGLPTYSLVTGLGIGGLAVALAGREALSNLIGTVAILLDQPFKVGDFVVIGDGEPGTVCDIGLRSTRIRTRDGILVSIPNSNVANMKIINESAPVRAARIHIPVGVAYGVDVREVREALLAVSKKSEYAVSDPPPSVRLVKFGDSALIFELLVWIQHPELKGRATHQLNDYILDEFRNRNIEIPFPQSDIHIRSGLSQTEK